jgi:hypothetical protein
MLRIAFVLMLTVPTAACVPPREVPAGSSQFPLGAYRIRSAQIDYYENGTYRIFDSRQTYVDGRYELDGHVITMTDVGGQYGCKGDTNPGKYRWSADEASIKFELIDDRCDARRTAMLESPFSRLEP